MSASLWAKCLNHLKSELEQDEYNTWVSPLQAQFQQPTNTLCLLAPNQFVVNRIETMYKELITRFLAQQNLAAPPTLSIRIGSSHHTTEGIPDNASTEASRPARAPSPSHDKSDRASSQNNLFGDTNTKQPNAQLTFDNFVVGKSNQLAHAAAIQVAQNPGQTYNPIFIYGGVGLGKTHLMHAIGNQIMQSQPGSRVLYLHSERFVADMIKALQKNAMKDFKDYYRSARALLVDDIQFFAGKDRSQEEFFHTFNTLVDNHHQIVLTCDRYPKEINGLEERLQSRFGWGLTVAIEPPELETRVAILMSKAEQLQIPVPHEVAFFIAKNIQSNVRELEGALKRVTANAHFTGQPITIDLARDSLKDLLTLQAKLISLDNIQKSVAHYYKIKVSDLLSKRRNRSITRPRQMAMSISKELTNHSLPEIGDAFGGRDHTTVLHACRKMKELLATNIDLQEDYKNLMRIISC